MGLLLLLLLLLILRISDWDLVLFEMFRLCDSFGSLSGVWIWVWIDFVGLQWWVWFGCGLIFFGLMGGRLMHGVFSSRHIHARTHKKGDDDG